MIRLGLRLRRIEPHDAALAQHRHDARDPELRRLLHDEIHPIAARHALHERDGERRFPVDRPRFADERRYPRAAYFLDRSAEFTATGDVAGLLRRTEHARRRLREDLVGFRAAAPPVSVRPDPDDPAPYHETKGAVLVHILEELFQHLGQMEITRDALVAGRRR